MAQIRLPHFKALVPKPGGVFLCKSMTAELGHFSNNKKHKGQSLSHGEKMKGWGVPMGEEGERGGGEVEGGETNSTVGQSHPRLVSSPCVEEQA